MASNTMCLPLITLLCLFGFSFGAQVYFNYPISTTKWYRGETHTISWASVADASGSVTFYTKLELYTGSGSGLKDSLITSNQPNSFTQMDYTMSVQQAFDSSGARFKLYFNESAGTADYVYTDYFDIEEQPWSLITTNPDSSSTWNVGSTYSIQWQSTGNISTVKLEISSSTSSSGTRTLIANNVPNTGSYDWTIPATFPYTQSSYWYIFITKVVYAPYHDSDTGTYSKYFNIDPAISDLLISSPTRNSIWKLGTTKAISWVCVGDIYHVKIELTTSTSTTSTPLSVLTAKTECQLGQFNWGIPGSLSPSSYYYIRISSVNRSVATSDKIIVSPSFEISATEDTDPALDPIPVYTQSCDDKCWANGLTGDSLCACTRLCGRLCLAGYKDALSGFNPFTQQTTRLIFNVSFARSDVFDALTLGTFYVPPNLQVNLESVEIQTATTSIVESLSEYQSLLAFGASVGGGQDDETSKVEGTLSTEYQNTKSKIQSKSVRLGYKEFNRYLYKVTTQGTDPASVKLNSFFLTDLAALPDTYNYQTYKAFLDKYGLYFFDYVKFGVSATITSLVSECVFKDNTAESVTVGLDAAAKTSDIGGSASFTQAEEQAKSCLAGKTEATLKLLGGDFSKYACGYSKELAEFQCNGTWNAYADTAKYNPYRLEYQLTRISSLISDPLKKSNLDQAISAYLSAVNASITNVFPAPYDNVPCPCVTGPVTTTTDKEAGAPPSQSLIIGIVVAGIIVAIIIAGVVKQYVCAPKEPMA